MSRRLRASAEAKPLRNGPVDRRAPEPEAWAVAKMLAGGDVRLLSVEADGTVIIHNDRVK